jgi:histone-lysine N-methyltransferase SETMAR
MPKIKFLFARWNQLSEFNMAAYADNSFKQKAVIEFLMKEGIATKEISDRLKTVYGEYALSYPSVRRWVADFKCGRTDIIDKPRSGRPLSAATDAKKQLVDELIRSDRRVTTSDIVDVTGVSRGTVHNIISDLGYSKVCSRWVPRQLTEELKQSRFEVCKQMLQRYQTEGEQFMKSIVTGDESWAHHYEPETKRQSMQWHHLGSPSPKKFKLSPSAGKVMISVFWDSRGVLLLDFLANGETINSARYQQTLKKLARSVREKRPDLQDVILHHDNARPHTARATTAAIAAKGWTILPHPAYSPDLAPSDFHLFGPLKDYLRGQKFDDDEAVKSAVKAWTRQCTPEFCASGFKGWRNRWEKCVACGGDYVEK